MLSFDDVGARAGAEGLLSNNDQVMYRNAQYSILGVAQK